MIERLVLKKFGRFENRTFLFGDSVVFYGPNESGKTTIFDALFTTLCRVPKQGTIRMRSISGTPTGWRRRSFPKICSESFDLGEFKDLYSIRSGDVALSFGDRLLLGRYCKGGTVLRRDRPGGHRRRTGIGRLRQDHVEAQQEIAQRKESLKKLGTVRDELEAERQRHARESMKSDELKERLANITAVDP